MSGFSRATASIALAAVLALPIGACNYGFIGGGLPAHIRTIYIAPLQNETPQFAVDQQLFTALTEELPRSLGLRQAGENAADAVLRGTITRYEDVAQNYRAGQPGSIDVIAHQVRITLTVQIVDVRDNVILFESTSVSGTGEYQPDTQSDEIARQRAIEQLIQRIVDGAQSQW